MHQQSTPAQFNPIGDVLNIEDVCRILGIARQTAYDEINSGRLRSFKIKSRRKFSREALMEYIREREAEQTQPAR